jgi:hypothetical protein
MAFNYSPKIITDGLVLYMDAANSKSYVSGSTTWNDISRGSNNGTLINGVSYDGLNGGSLVFDGTDDDILVTNNSNINFGEGSFTLCTFALRDIGLTSVLRAIAKGASNDSTSQAGYFIGASSESWVFSVNPTGVRTSLSTPMLYNTFTYVCGVYGDSGLMKLYINGELKQSTSVPTGSTTSNLDLNIGSRGGSLLFWNGRIASSQIYNRALSTSEVRQNYNATKTRFGLT